MAAEDGLSLVAYQGSDALTVGGELNKLAANVAIGRNAAGVHWRSDALEGLLLGEALALSVTSARLRRDFGVSSVERSVERSVEPLADLALTYHEEFASFLLTRFDGRRMTVGGQERLFQLLYTGN